MCAAVLASFISAFLGFERGFASPSNGGGGGGTPFELETGASSASMVGGISVELEAGGAGATSLSTFGGGSVLVAIYSVTNSRPSTTSVGRGRTLSLGTGRRWRRERRHIIRECDVNGINTIACDIMSFNPSIGCAIAGGFWWCLHDTDPISVWVP